MGCMPFACLVGQRTFPVRKFLAFLARLAWEYRRFWYGRFDRAILIVFVPLASLGVYSAALTAYGVLIGISAAFNNALLPVYSNIGGRRVLRAAGRRHRLVGDVTLVMVPLAFGLLATAKPALTFFVGEAYSGGAVPLMIFSLAFALTAFGSHLTPMLMALARLKR